jgi:hypothetical protein
MHAVSKGNLRMIKLLIQFQADLEVLDTVQRNLVHLASVKSNPQIFINLVNQGLNPDQLDLFNDCALHCGLANQGLRTFILNTEFIFKTPMMHPNSWTDVGRKSLLSSLPLMARRLRKERFQEIVDLHPSRSSSPLCSTASLGDFTKGIETLLSMGADIEFEGSPEGTALLAACAAGRFESVKHLVRRGARISYWNDKKHQSALVAGWQFPHIIKWLLVKRFTEQRKVRWRSEGPAQTDAVLFWSGPNQVELPLSGEYERLWGESLCDYVFRLHKVKAHLRGKVLSWHVESS